MLSLDVKEMTVVLDSANHWSPKTSKTLMNMILIQGFYFTPKQVTSFSVFEHMTLEDVESYFAKMKDYTLAYACKTQTGVVASIQTRPTDLDKVIDKITSTTSSRLWLRSNPDESVHIIVKCPWDLDIESAVMRMLKQFGLSPRTSPTIKDTTMHVPVPVDIPEIDDLDRKIAKTLLVNGYFLTPRPKGINQAKIAAKLDISKPTLEDRMRRITSIGIIGLLGIRGFTDTEVDSSWNVLQNKIRPKKS